ncbi:arginine--tRNA ligase [Olivibacter domesticus]|uniref:Arginine--tRNA ligase n=1 Tax=Olivibacter domesticus TaxID=407022 RepID=A0A1H7PUM4_OLID1|nr:arginine--tRNA ligase [Olivibacter domesticus]SEL39591.1 arginyl-tRNA synthetase [Olivibacter domesticus]
MNFIVTLTLQAIKKIYGEEIPESTVTLQETRKEFDGQVTIVTFPFTRFSKKSPEQTGADIGEYLVANSVDIEAYNVIKGFLNISLTDVFWLDQLDKQILKKDVGVLRRNGRKVMVEYSSPNTNKPLHLGHVRNNLLGYAVAELLNAAGYDVVKTNLVNDRGIHICKSMLAWQKFGNGETPSSSGLKGDKLVGNYYVRFDQEYKKEIASLMEKGRSEEEAKREAPLMMEAQTMLRKWEAGDTDVIKLWEMMNEWVYDGFEKTYKKMGVNFDKIYYESNTYLLGKDIIEEGISKGVFFKKDDNSVWIDLTGEGLDEKLVLRGDGTSVYITQDLGTAQLKYNDYHMDNSIYVVGNEQDYHFKVLFLILKKLGKSWAEGLYHLSYGMVDLPSGKMKSREGTVVDADDLMADMIDTARNRTEELGKVEGFSGPEKEALYEMIGLGALKYFLLKVEPKKRLLFDPNESIDFQGHTGPFIQYTHARIKSVLTKGGYKAEIIKAKPAILENTERDLIKEIVKFDDMVASAAENYSPSLIANYVYELSKLYNKFYHEVSIIKVEDIQLKNFRLNLSAATAQVIARGMKLLGIDVPERM